MDDTDSIFNDLTATITHPALHVLPPPHPLTLTLPQPLPALPDSDSDLPFLPLTPSEWPRAQNLTPLITTTIHATPASPAPPHPVVPRGNVSHTRRCRAKVNSNFSRLLSALPEPPAGVEVKHKAQILAYAIERFSAVRALNAQLEMRLALSSPYELRRWVRSVVSAARTLPEALKPFMAMICHMRNWKYAELWAPRMHDTDATTLRYISGALPRSVEGEELRRLRRYRANSRRYSFRPRSGVPGRVFLTMRPEWLPLLNDPVAFPRAPHAVRHKVEVTFAVPVIVNGAVQMVVEFYDTTRRDYDPDTVNMANEIAVLFGSAFTATASAQPTIFASVGA